MTIFDIAVIYITFGAPVGMYSLLRKDQSRLGFNAVAKATIDLILWPRLAFVLALNAAKVRSARSTYYKRKNPKKHITEEEDLLLMRLRGTHYSLMVPELRWSIDRFLALADALASETQNDELRTTVFAVAGHPDEEQGIACLNRRNRNRLRLHLNGARQQLMLAAGRQIAGSRASDTLRLLELIGRVADIADDDELRAVAASGLSITEHDGGAPEGIYEWTNEDMQIWSTDHAARTAKLQTSSSS